MPQLFPSSSRNWFRNIIALIICSFILILGGIYYNSFREWEYSPVQPIEFSHKIHMQLGLDCTFCHSSASRSPKAGMPSAESCMACHRHIMPNSPRIAPLRKAADPNYPQYTGTPIRWVMVNTWAGHAKFSHQAHITRGVACTECHGNISEMETVSTPRNRGMRWCIECHKNPAPSLRPTEAVTETDYSARDFLTRHQSGKEIRETDSESLGETLMQRWKISPPVNDCSACHY